MQRDHEHLLVIEVEIILLELEEIGLWEYRWRNVSNFEFFRNRLTVVAILE
jgi:hypothetical protein